jgi:RHS repeat-associated protein
MVNKLHIKLFLLLILFTNLQSGFPQKEDHNYVISCEPLFPVNDTSALSRLEWNKKRQSVSFYDGEARIIQKVESGVTPDGNDMVQTYIYDLANRQTTEYLPFPREKTILKSAFTNEPVSKLIEFYEQAPDQVASSNFPYVEKEFDNSPVNQVIQQGSPGETWKLNGEHTMKNVAYGNKEPVTKWTVNASEECMIDGNYPEGSLFVSETQDENGNISREFSTKNGQTILKESFLDGKKVQTSYVYDDKGLLRYVLPPLAVAKHSPDPNLIYQYEYDMRNRMIRKKLPGAEETEMVYDQLDRLVLSRDGNLRKDSLWFYTKYDELGRPVLAGLYKNPDSREEMQAILNTKSYNVENRRGAEYPNDAFPNKNCTPLSITYYDDYEFITNSTLNYTEASFALKIQEYPEIIEPVLATSTKGFITGSKIFISETGKWLRSVNYYDRYGKILQSIAENHLGGIDRSSQLYDFRGKIMNSKLEHKTGTGKQHSIEKRFEYDHAERLTKVYFKIDSLPAIVMAENKYNELGQLVEKKLHSANDDGNYLESTAYTYNIRGWMTSINDPENPGDHLFAMKLSYDQPEDGLDASAQYNGNISSMVWSTKSLTERRGYGFQYDDLNRLTKADYSKNSAGWNNLDEDYSVPVIGYDLNGNIDTLVRSGLVSTQNYGLIDQLKYSYIGNQLIAVDDEGEETEDEYDFSDRGSKYHEGNSLPEYMYDSNGNMISDANKGIIHIKYNHLNLPEEILLENNRLIRYLYDAGGSKLQKEVLDENGTLLDTWDYDGSFIYQNRQLKFILTDEGKIDMDSSEYNYEYFLKDHLGNTRVSFRVAGITPEVIQENHYYPFGMAMHGLNAEEMEQPEEQNKFLYNGKELQDDFGLKWYDYGARFYDAELGRWHFKDPMLEMNFAWSPYNYTLNNPIRFIDVVGLFPGDPLTNPKIRANRASNLFGEDIRTSCTVRHQGFDYQAPVGTEVVAVGAGTVIRVDDTDDSSYGLSVTLETVNEDGTTVYAFYAHLESIGVDEGAVIGEGEMIGTVGITGNADEDDSHLHFEVRTKLNPGTGTKDRVSPNTVTDTDFVSQDANANQTLTGVTKIESTANGIVKTNQNLNGTETVVRQPERIEKLEANQISIQLKL